SMSTIPIDQKTSALTAILAAKQEELAAKWTKEMSQCDAETTALSQILLDHLDGPLTPEQEKQVKFIRTSAQNLTDLVNDLLDLAKVEAGKVKIRPNRFQMTSLFAGLRGMLRPLLSQNSSVNLVFEEPVDIPEIYSDEAKISQILRNFISN